MRNPFNAIRRCEELTLENARLNADNHRLQHAANEALASRDHWKQIADDTTAKLQVSEQDRAKAVNRLVAANRENKQLLVVNARLAEHLGRRHFKSNINQEEEQ